MSPKELKKIVSKWVVFKFLKVAADLNHDVVILLLRIVTMDPEQTARQ